jgi:sporulation protein YlmC with PRC-barrel domain
LILQSISPQASRAGNLKEAAVHSDNLAEDDVSNSHSRRRLISADRVQGTPVYDTAGEKLGHIEDVMLHKVSGRVAYAIMSFGGFLGAGERYHPLPWSLLTYDVEKHGYVVPLGKAQLDSAPTQAREHLDADDDGAWADEVHAHYGLPGPFI